MRIYRNTNTVIRPAMASPALETGHLRFAPHIRIMRILVGPEEGVWMVRLMLPEFRHEVPGVPQ